MLLAEKLAARTTQDWFMEAEHTYTEKHQGCPWCGGSHRVFCQRRGTNVIFYCQGCDFQASHDAQSNEYRMIPGIHDPKVTVPDTMCGLPRTLTS